MDITMGNLRHACKYYFWEIDFHSAHGGEHTCSYQGNLAPDGQAGMCSEKICPFLTHADDEGCE